MLKLKLAKRFTLLLSMALLGGILISSVVLSNVIENRAEAVIAHHAQVLMEVVDSVRTYTDNRVSPLLAAHINTASTFVPETIPSFAAREVFELLRKNPEYKDYFYKDAVLNPTNPLDQADGFETEIAIQFQQRPGLQVQSGFREVAGKQMFYSTRPIIITKPSCLNCHGTPEQAPRGQLAIFGSRNGFGWKLNQVIGSQIIYIPAWTVFRYAHASFVLFILIFIAIFTMVILLLNLLLQQMVIKPIKPMAELAQKIADDTFGTDPKSAVELKKLEAITRRFDELGQLGRILQRMVREIQIREQALKQQLQVLQIEIDQSKRAQQVAEITESDYFQKLKQDAKEIRAQRRSRKPAD
uniref:Putative sensor with HAMP domain protein n=1 Tax=Cyanothece sp. (strain PCC 7425 / ATCC 29141) TaxID=395961 RepID=B8HSJ4_CYAP4